MVILLFRRLDAFKAFDIIYMVTGGGPGNATEVLSYKIWHTAFFQNRIGYSAALSIVAMRHRHAADAGLHPHHEEAPSMSNRRRPRWGHADENRGAAAGLVGVLKYVVLLLGLRFLPLPDLLAVHLVLQDDVDIFSLPPKLLFKPTLANFVRCSERPPSRLWR